MCSKTGSTVTSGMQLLKMALERFCLPSSCWPRYLQQMFVTKGQSPPRAATRSHSDAYATCSLSSSRQQRIHRECVTHYNRLVQMCVVCENAREVLNNHNFHLISSIPWPRGSLGHHTWFRDQFSPFFPVPHCPLGFGEFQACPFPQLWEDKKKTQCKWRKWRRKNQLSAVFQFCHFCCTLRTNGGKEEKRINC